MNQNINFNGMPLDKSGPYDVNYYNSPGFCKFIGFLQYKISGYKNNRFNREQLHGLYEIFQKRFNWKPLNRHERRNKELVFMKLYQHKDSIQYLIQTCPEVYLKPILLLKPKPYSNK